MVPPSSDPGDFDHLPRLDRLPGRGSSRDRIGAIQNARDRVAVVIQAFLKMPHISDHGGAVPIGTQVRFRLETGDHGPMLRIAVVHDPHLAGFVVGEVRLQ